jgi:hypothetical protein
MLDLGTVAFQPQRLALPAGARSTGALASRCWRRITLEVEGNPTTTLKAGDLFHIAPGKIHQAINNGTVTAKLAAVFVAEKGKPLTTKAQ